MANEVALKEHRATLREYLNSEVVQDQLTAALPRFMQLDRFIRVTYTAILDNPNLLTCTKESIVGCMIRMAQLGLEPVLGKAWLIPYRNNDKPGNPIEAQFQVGWRGFVELAKRSGKVSKVTARTVFEEDEFEVVYGTEDKLIHKPAFKSDKPILYYAVFFYGGNGDTPSFMVMTPSEVEKIRKSSKAPNSPAWKNWYEQMAWKSVIKRLAKREDLSIEVDEAVHIDDMAMIGAPQYGELPQVDGPRITETGGLSDAVKTFDEQLAEEEKKSDRPEEKGEFEKLSEEIQKKGQELQKQAEQEELERRALIKTFDAKVEKEKIPQQFVTDFLFDSLAAVQKSERGKEIQSIPDLKIWILNNNAYDNFVNDLTAYAERKAEKDLEEEVTTEEKVEYAGSCSKCHKKLQENEIVQVPNGKGGTLFYCIECTPKDKPEALPKEEKEETPPEIPPAEEEIDLESLDWSKGLPLGQLEDHQIVNTFINLRTSKDPKLGLKGWIVANPGWNDCSDFVRKKIIKKWNTLYTGESLDAFMKELVGDKPAKDEPDGFITEKQYKELYAWSEKKGIGWARVVKYAEAKGLTKAETGPGGVETARISEDGAASMLADLDGTFKDMLAFYQSQ